MNTSHLTSHKLFGLLGLDAAGTVLHSRIERDGDAGVVMPDVNMSNFFTEIAPFENVEEFRPHLECFRRSQRPAENSLSPAGQRMVP